MKLYSVTTLAGDGSGGYQDGSGINSKFNRPYGIAISSSGNIFIADTYNHRIRKISSIGVVTTIAGDGSKGYQDGSGINDKFNYPHGIAIDKDGNLFIADHNNHRIRKISSIGVVTTIAGDGYAGYQDGSGINSKFNSPWGIAIDKDGNLFIADSNNHRIRKISSIGVVTTIAGDGTIGYQDGNGINSKFNSPSGVAIDKDGNIFITDTYNHRIRKLSVNGVVSTVAGDGSGGYQDGSGINSKFYHPWGIAIDKNGNLFIADYNNHRIRKISSIGVVTTVAGDGTAGYQDGNGINSKFNHPIGLAIDSDGCNLFVCDYYTHRIRQINFKEKEEKKKRKEEEEEEKRKRKKEEIEYMFFSVDFLLHIEKHLKNIQKKKTFKGRKGYFMLLEEKISEKNDLDILSNLEYSLNFSDPFNYEEYSNNFQKYFPKIFSHKSVSFIEKHFKKIQNKKTESTRRACFLLLEEKISEENEEDFKILKNLEKLLVFSDPFNFNNYSNIFKIHFPPPVEEELSQDEKIKEIDIYNKEEKKEYHKENVSQKNTIEDLLDKLIEKKKISLNDKNLFLSKVGNLKLFELKNGTDDMLAQLVSSCSDLPVLSQICILSAIKFSRNFTYK